MNCPKCYGKIDKRTKRCQDCGFNIKSIDGALHSEVKRARKEGFGDDVIYTSTLPKDIKKKKLLLLCIFLGLFGAHSYYAGKIWKGIYSSVVSAVFIPFAIVKIIIEYSNYTFNVPVMWVFSSVLLLAGINIFLWFFDLVNIITKKYKVSVYKDEFSN